MEMKIRMLQLGIKQADIIRMLSKKGINVAQSELSQALNEMPQERYQKLREEVNKLLIEKEQSNGLQKSTV